MELKEILVKQGLEEDQAAAVEKALADNKIFLTKEENIEARFNKMRDQRDSKQEELNAANKLVEDLQKVTGENEEAKKQVADYQEQVKALQTKLADGEKSALVNKALEEAGATDVDYLVYKLGGISQLELKDGAVTDLANKVKELQEKVPNYFKQAEQEQPEEPKAGYKPIDTGLQDGKGAEGEQTLAARIAANLANKE